MKVNTHLWSNKKAKEPVVPKFPPNLLNTERTSATVRVVLSVNVSTNTATNIKQMKIGQAGAKMRGYKNTYTNVSVKSLGNGAYKVSSLRQPKGETYKLKTYMVVKKINGKWQITEELMQTKEQIF